MVNKVYRTKDQGEGGEEISYRVVKRHDSRLGQTVYDLMETRNGIETRHGWFTEISVAYITLWEKRGWTS